MSFYLWEEPRLAATGVTITHVLSVGSKSKWICRRQDKEEILRLKKICEDSKLETVQELKDLVKRSGKETPKVPAATVAAVEVDQPLQQEEAAEANGTGKEEKVPDPKVLDPTVAAAQVDQPLQQGEAPETKGTDKEEKVPNPAAVEVDTPKKEVDLAQAAKATKSGEKRKRDSPEKPTETCHT